MQNTLIVLLGPTGVGKTDFSIVLARHLGCEIISCDSRQFYHEMSIGTSVPSEAQLKSIKHHFIRFLSVIEYYSSSLFERDILDLLPKLFKKSGVAILTGGSGMYIDAVCQGYDDIPDVDSSIREKYNSIFRTEGIESLRIALKMFDPEHYENIDLKNYKRIIRALEICETTGKPYSAFLKKKKKIRDFRIIKVGLNRPRPELYKRINSRVDKMVEEGLEDEARSLFGLKNNNALNTVGYKEFFEYFDGKISREKAIELIKRNSRRYSKRQLTWWARDKEIRWFHPDQQQEILNFIISKID
jgi:tRNA dimethylallyltransferase